VTDAIEKIIDGYAAIDRTLSGIGRSDEQHIAAARAELAALRAENEQLHAERRRNAIAGQATMEEAYATIQAQARQIAALREALESLDILTVPEDEPSANVALRLSLMIQKARSVLRSVPPSSMRLVPLERLREIEWAWHHCEETGEEWQQCPVCGGYEKGSGHGPHCWLSAAIAGKETGGGEWTCPQCRRRPPANAVRLGKDGHHDQCVYCGAEIQEQGKETE